jgi:hypothetical protein
VKRAQQSGSYYVGCHRANRDLLHHRVHGEGQEVTR